MPNWEENAGQTQNSLEGLLYISHLAREHFGIPEEELGSTARERHFWNTLPTLLPQ